MLKKLLNNFLSRLYAKAQHSYLQERYAEYRKNYNVADSFGFNGTDIRIYGDGHIILGADSYVGSYSTFQLSKGTTINVGKTCQISHNVRMYTSTDIANQDFLTEDRKTKKGDIIIGDGVWIGANVFIGPGINIGSNSIIGANSVVTKNIPSNSIWGGVPAKHIKLKL